MYAAMHSAGQEKEKMGGEGEKEERLAQEEGVRGAGVCARTNFCHYLRGSSSDDVAAKLTTN